MIAIAISSAVTVVAVSLGFRALKNSLRRKRFAGLELRPNCLLTRYPIVFIAGRRSLFKPFDQWNDIPLFLREHGYEVAVFEAPAPEWNKSRIAKALTEFGQPCHLIGDTSNEAVIEELAFEPGLPVQSITVVNSGQKKDSKPPRKLIDELKPRRSAVEAFEVTPFRLRPQFLNSNSWNLEERFLDLAISLAERDAQWSD